MQILYWNILSVRKNTEVFFASTYEKTLVSNITKIFRDYFPTIPLIATIPGSW